ncbi:GDSL-type esterase/lipase family protein [Hominenteromicrobium sp.]|uniref:GDSL-type esterase/lipase family protein n=1 Tax=Hominenteromicrobium sp. TaxID=3073581 RepID=UPI0039999C88
MTDWEMKVHNFMCLNKFVKKGEIVFTGSSLCELFPINEMLQNVEPRIRVYNRGIGGDVTDGLLERMDESIFDLEPKKVFINIGTNDISRPEYKRERLMSQYRKILMQICRRVSPETKTYVMSYYLVNCEMLPVAQTWSGEGQFGARTNAELEAVNAEVGKWQRSSGCAHAIRCVRLGLLDEKGNLKAEYTIEGMHMYANGYAVVLEKLMPYLLEE